MTTNLRQLFPSNEELEKGTQHYDLTIIEIYACRILGNKMKNLLNKTTHVIKTGISLYDLNNDPDFKSLKIPIEYLKFYWHKIVGEIKTQLDEDFEVTSPLGDDISIQQRLNTY